MKYVLNILVVICFVAAAAETPKADQKSSATAPAKKAATAPARTRAAAGPVQIPGNAREVGPGLFEAKDAAGKTWHYTRTPFGVRKFPPQKPVDSTSLVSEEADRIVSAIEEGGKVNFERKTPFGTAKWSKTRAELNDAERLALRRLSQARAITRKPAANAAKPAAQE